MIDHDGQRPEALERLLRTLSLVQVTIDGTEKAASLERISATLRLAADKHVAHSVAIVPGDALSDGPLFRIVEQIHEASGDAQIVVHPVVEQSVEHDRRWVVWMERAMAVHADVRVLPRWPSKPAPR
jgi:aromatic ring-cleaving dioxygenase